MNQQVNRSAVNLYFKIQFAIQKDFVRLLLMRSPPTMEETVPLPSTMAIRFTDEEIDWLWATFKSPEVQTEVYSNGDRVVERAPDGSPKEVLQGRVKGAPTGGLVRAASLMAEAYPERFSDPFVGETLEEFKARKKVRAAECRSDAQMKYDETTAHRVERLNTKRLNQVRQYCRLSPFTHLLLHRLSTGG